MHVTQDIGGRPYTVVRLGKAPTVLALTHGTGFASEHVKVPLLSNISRCAASKEKGVARRIPNQQALPSRLLQAVQLNQPQQLGPDPTTPLH